MHSIWQRVRRPFRYPKCVQECKWEVYDATQAGCLLCGAPHVCKACAFEGNCPLVECDDGSRVCTITGYIIPEVRYSHDEYVEHVSFESTAHTHHHHHPHRHHHHPHTKKHGSCNPTLPKTLPTPLASCTSSSPSASIHPVDLETEVGKYIEKLLDSYDALRCRREENSHQSKKLYKSFIKCIRNLKLERPHESLPNICDLLTSTMHMEKRTSFIYPASAELKHKCQRHILLCILDLRQRGYRICGGNKLQDLVCGLLYLLRTGITYKNHDLLSAIPEISRCLPMESRLQTYFRINSKVITSVENEIKLAFRDFLQH